MACDINCAARGGWGVQSLRGVVVALAAVRTFSPRPKINGIGTLPSKLPALGLVATEVHNRRSDVVRDTGLNLVPRWSNSLTSTAPAGMVVVVNRVSPRWCRTLPRLFADTSSASL